MAFLAGQVAGCTAVRISWTAALTEPSSVESGTPPDDATGEGETGSESDDSDIEDGESDAAESLGVLPATAGTHDLLLTHDGLERTARLIIPENFNPSAGNALVFVLHGAGETASGFANKLAELKSLAATAGWLLLFPQGLEKTVGPSETSWSWAVPPQEGEWGDSPPDDAAFIVALADEAIEQLGVSTSRIALTGFSKGGRMVQTIAGLHPDRFAAIAITSTNFASPFTNTGELDQTAAPTAPIPILMAHGMDDPLIPYNGSEDGDSSFADQIERWRSVNGCASSPSVTTPATNIRIEDYSPCAGKLLRAHHIRNLDHRWVETGDGLGWSFSVQAVSFLDSYL